ncbi:MAG TPA: hypothetical protein VHT03_07505 [Rhizomicrobium sp.]|jgi:hypothetical protein|nr:hypothetical protein [Rhizomicrobium sp.]
MTKMLTVHVVAALVGASLLAACVPSVDEVKAEVIEKGKAYCAAKGKVFVLNTLSGERTDTFWRSGAAATAAGECIEPSPQPPPVSK